MSRLNPKIGMMPEVGMMNLERLLPLINLRPRTTGLRGTMARQQPPKTQKLVVVPPMTGLLSPIKNNLAGQWKW